MQAQNEFVPLEHAIVSSEGPDQWLAYADALYKQGRYHHAAQAYTHILTQNPYHPRAQVQKALAIAQSNDSELLFTWMQELTLEQALMASELFARAELYTYLKEQRFQDLAHQARIQAVD